MDRQPGGPLRRLPMNRLAPNMVTTLALCSGLTSIRFSLQERWEAAVIAILLAALLDGIDGRLARLLKGSTKFGAELDSLSDFLCFGVAPVILLYRWSLSDLGNIGWLAVLVYATCCALRLARFNSALEDTNQPAWAANFFTGVPSPAAAGLVILFPVLSFQFGDVVRWAPINFVWAIAIGLLMVSRVPAFSFKKIKIRRELTLLLLVGFGIFVALLMTEPWLTLIALAAGYLALLPFSIRARARHQRVEPWPTLMAEPLMDTPGDDLDDEPDERLPPAPPGPPPITRH